MLATDPLLVHMYLLPPLCQDIVYTFHSIWGHTKMYQTWSTTERPILIFLIVISLQYIDICVF